MARSYRLQSYDLAASFGQDAPGRLHRRVIDNDGTPVLTQEVWAAGFLAYEALRKHAIGPESQPDPTTGSELAHSFESIAAEIDGVLCTEFLPNLLDQIDSGRVRLEPLQASAMEFKKAWDDYDIVERIEPFLQVVTSSCTVRSPGPDVLRIIESSAAFAVLLRIDDAVIALKLSDIESALSCGADVERFRASLEFPRKASAIGSVAAAKAISLRASKGGKAKNEKLLPAREFVQLEWEKHRDEYLGNKSEFSRIYARRVLNEFGVEVTDKTIRESWLQHHPTAG